MFDVLRVWVVVLIGIVGIGGFVELLFSVFSGGCLLFDLLVVVGLGYFACGGIVC